MESAQFLDILGNKNRRNILQLLASRPYYISEISDRIGVGQKAVLDHLGLLEQSGLIRSKTTKQRRKYYHITENLKLEVFVSPYSYTVETSVVIQQPSTQTDQKQSSDQAGGSQSIKLLKQLNKYLFQLESKRRQLAEKQCKVEGEMIDIMSKCIDMIQETAQNNPEAEIMTELLKHPQDKRSLSINLDLPEYFLEEHIRSLIDKQIIIEREKDNKKIMSLL
jgi:ArsR family transcriptional regulator